MPRNPNTPHRILELPVVGKLELVATLRAFQLFKTRTAELGMGERTIHGFQKGVPILGRARGLSILRGGLEELDEDTIPALVWALAHGETIAGQELEAPDHDQLDAALQDPDDIVRALECVLELVREATGADDDEEEEGDDSERNHDEDPTTEGATTKT